MNTGLRTPGIASPLQKRYLARLNKHDHELFAKPPYSRCSKYLFLLHQRYPLSFLPWRSSSTHLSERAGRFNNANAFRLVAFWCTVVIKRLRCCRSRFSCSVPIGRRENRISTSTGNSAHKRALRCARACTVLQRANE